MLQNKLGVYSFLGIEILVFEELIKGLRGWIQLFLGVIVIQVNRTKSGGHNTSRIKATCLNIEDPKNSSPITKNCHIVDLLYECHRHTWMKMVCPLPTCTIHFIWPRNSVVHLSFKLSRKLRNQDIVLEIQAEGTTPHITWRAQRNHVPCLTALSEKKISLISNLNISWFNLRLLLLILLLVTLEKRLKEEIMGCPLLGTTTSSWPCTRVRDDLPTLTQLMSFSTLFSVQSLGSRTGTAAGWVPGSWPR